jgi:SsrA-binding protein
MAKPKPEKKESGNSVVADNRKAFRDYHILESLEAGIVLTGTEVKSLREGRCNLQDSYARFEKGAIVLFNAHIAPYSAGNIANHEPLRPRKLLLRRNQILRFYGRLTEKGLTLIPLKIYFKHGLAKCEIALAIAKKIYDRREAIKKKEARREMERAVKNRNVRRK